MKLYDKSSIKAFLEKENFVFKKSLGQNFLIDGSVAPRMADFAAGRDTGVIEIGPGAGVLTRELALRAKRVLAIEIDKKLKPVLEKTLENIDNAEVVFADVLKTDLKKLIAEKLSDCGSVTVCANLPYYITSPVIMKLLKDKLPVKSITVMVQKEAAERICAPVGSRKAGAVTAAVRYYAEPEMLFPVPRSAFLPAPNVDSAVITLNICDNPPVSVKDENFFFKTVNACFMLRRKTAINSLASATGKQKQELAAVFKNLGIPETARGETFTLQTLADLSNSLFRE